MPEVTTRDALRQTLREALQRDSRVILMGEDIGAYGGSYAVTRGLFDEFGPERIRDTPIAESVVVGAAIGSAMVGMRPVVEVMTINFSLLAIDQIVNNASKIHYMSDGQIAVPVVIRMATGGGSHLSAQHLRTSWILGGDPFPNLRRPYVRVAERVGDAAHDRRVICVTMRLGTRCASTPWGRRCAP